MIQNNNNNNNNNNKNATHTLHKSLTINGTARDGFMVVSVERRYLTAELPVVVSVDRYLSIHVTNHRIRIQNSERV